MSKPKGLIVVASTRPGRIGAGVGTWAHGRARAHGGFDWNLVDLAELALPFMDEPRHPRLGQYEHAHTREWSATVEGVDVVVFVTPEYNHGYNAPLKNAIDFLHNEWQHKPVGFVSYGGISAGLRAVQSLRPVLAALRMLPALNAVHVAHASTYVREDRTFAPTADADAAARTMFDELLTLLEASRVMRPADVSPNTAARTARS